MKLQITQQSTTTISNDLLSELHLFVAGRLGIAKYNLETDIAEGFDTSFNQDNVDEATELLDRIVTTMRGK